MYITTKQAAARLEVSCGEVRRLLNKGLLEGVRMPEGADYGVWCVVERDVQRYQKQRRSRGRPRKGDTDADG